ncbi:hypothetical protein M9H77_31692 [Catharanthus roseus]|uniref:Uncharacterized protein n=1 Tax=Catharanthus roseus TaxID=4058 RepID=A0ACC0A0R6_CATRO|nr:hypothetical protein M9H77_31692 [Catharanthus roseus]
MEEDRINELWCPRAKCKNIRAWVKKLKIHDVNEANDVVAYMEETLRNKLEAFKIKERLPNCSQFKSDPTADGTPAPTVTDTHKSSHSVTGSVYKTREWIHPRMAFLLEC